MEILTQEQLDRFHEDGYLKFRRVISDEQLEAMRAAGEIQTAAVLDMDLHYGNGTAQLAATRQFHFPQRILPFPGMGIQNQPLAQKRFAFVRLTAFEDADP